MKNISLIFSFIVLLSACKDAKTEAVPAPLPTVETNATVGSSPSKVAPVKETPAAMVIEEPIVANDAESKSTITEAIKTKQPNKNLPTPQSETKTPTKTTVVTKTNQPQAAAEKSIEPTKEAIESVKETKVTSTAIPKTINKEAVQEATKVPVTKAAILSHTTFDALLRKYVSNGKVDYAGMKTEISTLNTYLKSLEATEISSLSKNEQLAFWINAYNAYTIKLILNNYPVGSITDLEGGKPWDKKWIALDGKTLSLNNIENDIIRPTFNEPRIHFAVNCAAKSCPPLLNQAWTAENLESNFEKQTKAFVNNNTYNSFTSTKATISKIFEWYAVDFGDLVAFLNKYSNTKLDSNAEVAYKEYDWSLNK